MNSLDCSLSAPRVSVVSHELFGVIFMVNPHRGHPI